ncbi:Transcriptional regulatory protein QseF [Bienertia sinuspersici]
MDSISNEKVINGKNNMNFVDNGQILEEGNLRKKVRKRTKGVLTHSKTMKGRSHTSIGTTSTTKNKN